MSTSGVVNEVTDQPLISMIIPFYCSYAPYFADCLDSVFRQTHTNWEIIVVDDASPDGGEGVRTIIEKYADPRIHLIRHERNRGCGAARNTGIRACKGDFFIPLDSDDMLAPTHIEKVLQCLKANPGSNVAYTDYHLFSAVSREVQFPIRDTRALLRDQWIPQAGTIFPCLLWERAQGYCEDDIFRPGNEDWDFFLRLAEVGLQPVRLPEPSYYYRQHESSMSSTTLAYSDYITREAIYIRHQVLFDTAGMKRPFLACGYRISAKASWRRRERLKAIKLLLRALWLSPSDFVGVVFRKARTISQPLVRAFQENVCQRALRSM